jgi:hypothetical protein
VYDTAFVPGPHRIVHHDDRKRRWHRPRAKADAAFALAQGDDLTLDRHDDVADPERQEW